MNAIISLCHFCELHGPSILFCTQAFHTHDPKQVLETEGEECQCHYGGQERQDLKCHEVTAGDLTPTTPSSISSFSKTSDSCEVRLDIDKWVKDEVL